LSWRLKQSEVLAEATVARAQEKCMKWWIT